MAHVEPSAAEPRPLDPPTTEDGSHRSTTRATPSAVQPSARQRAGIGRRWLAQWRWWSGAAVLMAAMVLSRVDASGAVELYGPFVLIAGWAAVVLTLTLWLRGDDGNGDGGND